MQPRPEEVWGNGSAYELYVGRWSRPVARDFVNWLAVPATRLWLDVGCGTGALGRSIVENAAPGRVDRTDRSFGCVTFAKEHKRAKALNVVVGEAQALPIADGIYDAAVSGLLLNFIPEPQRAVREMARVGKSGSIVAAFVWD